jgi:hypothetical protein
MAQMPAQSWHGAAGRVYTGLLYTKPSTSPPHARGRSGTRWGSSASQPPVQFRPYPLWVVGAGSGRVPGLKFAAGTAVGAAGGFMRHREGQKSVGVCPLGGVHQKARSLCIILGHTMRKRCQMSAWGRFLEVRLNSQRIRAMSAPLFALP